MAENSEDVPMADVPMTNAPEPIISNPPKPKGHALTTKTIKTPPHSYLHLSLHSSSYPPSPLDEITVRTHLTSALTQFLGLHGSAISVDILKVEKTDVWIRVPREDCSAVVAAVGGWIRREERRDVGWTVRGKGNWLGALVGRAGVEKIWGD